MLCVWNPYIYLFIFLLLFLTGSTVSSVSTAFEPCAAWASPFDAITTTAYERESHEAHRELEDSAAATDAIADVAAASSTSAAEGEYPSIARALVSVCLGCGSKGCITSGTQYYVTSIASIVEVRVLSLEQVLEHLLDLEAVYLMTLLAALCHNAHSMRDIGSTASRGVED